MKEKSANNNFRNTIALLAALAAVFGTAFVYSSKIEKESRVSVENMGAAQSSMGHDYSLSGPI